MPGPGARRAEGSGIPRSRSVVGGLGLAAADCEHVLHWLDDALTFLVYPDREGRGLVRLEGTWTADAND